MIQAHLEVERTYALADDTTVPDLQALPGVASVGEPRVAELQAVYVDTADLALIRNGITLRRRTGGADAGWHLKVPEGDGRAELHRPLSRSVPAQLAALVTGVARGRDVAPVAEIVTVRTTTHLLAADGSVLAEVADDRVVGRSLDDAPAAGWRELEIELVGAGRELFDDVEPLLAAAGITPSGTPRKIAHVLGHRLAVETGPWDLPAGADEPAGRLVQQRLREQVAELRRFDVDVRRRVPDGVHQLRVTCRRLRGALATFRPVLDTATSEPLRTDLRWVARTLGDGRDAEVMHERLRGLVDDEPRALVIGPVRRRLDRTYRDRLRAADGHADDVLGSRRYLRLLERLDRLVSSPAFTADAAAPATDVLLSCVAGDYRRLKKRVKAATELRRADPLEHLDRGFSLAYDHHLHEVRKAAKRLRYACEAMEPVWGSDAKALRKAAQEVTRVLGDRQDGAVARADLRRIAVDATRAGESAFTYGVLVAREEARAAEAESEWWELWERVRDRELRSWL